MTPTPLVYYSGVGCNPTYKHTRDEFITIMKREFQHKSWAIEIEIYGKACLPELNYKDWILPDDFCFFTIEDWIDFAGARESTARESTARESTARASI